jgi:Zn-finger nucleic acid-binding protein
MNCPACLIPLTMSDRQGVEIDYCPQCRGVWLDRGELDKIIERSGAAFAPPPSPPAPEGYAPPPSSLPTRVHRREYDDDDDGNFRAREGYPGHSKKKKGFLGELFDF